MNIYDNLPTISIYISLIFVFIQSLSLNFLIIKVLFKCNNLTDSAPNNDFAQRNINNYSEFSWIVISIT